MQPFGIHWFRRDLRVVDNPALAYNLNQNQGRVLGLFCFDSTFLARDDFSHNRFAFFLQTLAALKSDLEQIGLELLVVDCLPDQAFPTLISQFKQPPALVSWNRDYEPFARARDEHMTKLLTRMEIEVHTARDHLIIEPHELMRNVQSGYQVYSPYAKRWFEMIKTQSFNERVKPISKIDRFPPFGWTQVAKTSISLVDSLESFQTKNQKSVTVPIPKAGHQAAWERLKHFKKNILADYGTSRDLLAQDGTSALSIYFKNGSLTTAQAISFLELAHTPYQPESSASRYLKELVWREFYYSILWHHPRVEHEAFLEKYKHIKWQNNPDWFRRWCEGTTGFPIIDAAMRQLNTTGWMHNRARMIVASFLTKDLLIDWRWGERYFMKMLLDGDMADNNGGWQWAASTGCDPQPYFRIFNPYLQSQKFDPTGDYIRKYVPELKSVKGKSIHNPNDVTSYPKPVVNHTKQKTLALNLYKNL